MKLHIILISSIAILSCSQPVKEKLFNNEAISQSGFNYEHGFDGYWEWEKNNDNQDFSIDIKIINNKLFLSYCCVMQEGQKIDCPDNDGNQYSLTVLQPDEGFFQSSFKSYYNELLGEVKISLVGEKLIWEIIKTPGSNFFCPNKATFKKIKA